MVLNSLGRHKKPTDHKILTASSCQIIHYLAEIPKHDLQYVFCKFVHLQKKNRLNDMFYSMPDMLLFLPLNIPMHLTFPVRCLTFPVIDFLKMFSPNLTSLTLGGVGENLTKNSVRTLFTWLKELKSLVVHDALLTQICLTLLSGPNNLLPNLQSIAFHDRPKNCKCLKMHNCACQSLVVKLLMAHPNLNELSFSGSLSIFQKLHTKLALRRLKAESLDSVKIGGASVLIGVASTCPDISSLDLSSHLNGNLVELANLKNLTRLSLTNNSDLSKFDNISNVFGLLPYLKELVLDGFSNVCTLSLTISASLLEELQMSFCSFVGSSNTRSGFKRLRKLVVIRPKNRSFQQNNLLHLLSKSTGLRRLELRGDVRCLSGVVLDDLLEINALNELRFVHIATCSLTVRSIITLLMSDNPLTDIYVCSNLLFHGDIPHIRRCILRNNYAVIAHIIGSEGIWMFINNTVQL